MFPELNMTINTKAMSDGVIAAEIHHIQGSNRNKHETRALFVHEEEERQNKYNQKLEEMNSQWFDHKGAQRVICYVWSVKEHD